MSEFSPELINSLRLIVGALIFACWVGLFMTPLLIGSSDADDAFPFVLGLFLFIALYAAQAFLTFEVYNPLIEALSDEYN